MTRFRIVQQAFTSAITTIVAQHPHLFDDLTEEDARALGREAADRAVAHVLLAHVDKKPPAGEPVTREDIERSMDHVLHRLTHGGGPPGRFVSSDRRTQNRRSHE